MELIQKIRNRLHKKVDVVLPVEEPKVKIDAEESCYFLLQNSGKNYSFICPNFPVKIEGQGEDLKLTIYYTFPKIELGEGQPSTICIDYTNDPTPHYSGCVCSLGYYLLRIHLLNAKVVIEPEKIVCTGKISDYSVYLNRPQRELYIDLPPSVNFDGSFLGDNPFFKKSYIFQKSNWEPIRTITYFEKDNNYVVLTEIIDMRSFYAGIVLDSNRLFSNKEESIEYYNKLVTSLSPILREEFKPRWE